MTDTIRESYDLKGEHEEVIPAKRNKYTDADGTPYENRQGTWTERKKAMIAEGVDINSWLTMERHTEELRLLNYPGKRGRPYEYTPSLTNYLMGLRNNSDLSFNRIIGDK